MLMVSESAMVDANVSEYPEEQITSHLNYLSQVNVKRWSRAALTAELSNSKRLPIKILDSDQKYSHLTKMRLNGLYKALMETGLNPCFWFVQEELTHDMWVIDNPFLLRKVIVRFSKSYIKDYMYITHSFVSRGVPTKNLLKAILMGQP